LIPNEPTTGIEVAVRDPVTQKALFVTVADGGGYAQMDGAEVVAECLQDHLSGNLATLQTHRVKRLVPLQPLEFGNPEVPRLRGAR
jgi:hypothetical protein